MSTASEARAIGDLIRKSDCYLNTVGAVDKSKVDSEAHCVRKLMPSSYIGQAAARAYRLACQLEPQPPPPPPPTRVLFAHHYAYVRGPQSGSETEKLDALASTHTYKAVALNVGDHPASDWSTWRSMILTRGLLPIPWARCLTIAHIVALRTVAESWNALGMIVNLEQDDTPARWQFTGAQAAAPLAGYQGELGISTEPWLPDNLDWQPLQALGAVCLPQTSTLEFPQATPSVAVARAKALGWQDPVPSFATYDVPAGTPERNDYVWPGVFGIYTLDDIAPQEVQLWV